MVNIMETREEAYKKYVLQSKRKDYIKVEDLEPGWLYHIHARNAHYGIWKQDNLSFTIRRKKFGAIYTFDEFHWDTSESFGTVKPFKKLELSPFSQDDLKDRSMKREDGTKYWSKPLEEEILAYLKNIEGEY